MYASHTDISAHFGRGIDCFRSQPPFPDPQLAGATVREGLHRLPKAATIFADSPISLQHPRRNCDNELTKGAHSAACKSRRDRNGRTRTACSVHCNPAQPNFFFPSEFREACNNPNL
jgi:hypothetical protein